MSPDQTYPGVAPRLGAAPPDPWPTPDGHPFRRTFIVAESLVCAGAVVGTWQLLTDTFTPDVALLKPLGLSTWKVPGLWLFTTAAAPAGAAAWLAWRRSPRAPDAVLATSGLLSVELAVQMPFLGFSPLQPAMGLPALALAGLARRARSAGWRPVTPGSAG